MQSNNTPTEKKQNNMTDSLERPKFDTIRELFKSMPLGFNAEAAASMDTVIQFRLSGKDAIDGFFIIKDSTCTFEEGLHSDPATIIHADSELWLAISNQEISGEAAFIKQQYTVEGDMTILLKFNSLFSLSSEEEQERIPAYKTDFDYHAFNPGYIKKIVVFDGGPRKAKFSKTLFMVNHFCAGAISAGAQVEHIKLAKKNIHPCLGCYTCWTKTPGQCIHKDDMADLRLKYRKADLIVYASPLYVYSVTGIMKNFLDRMVPNLKPYMQLHNGITRHPYRFSDDNLKGFVVFSAAGFPEVAGNFDGLKAMFRCLHTANEKASLMGEFFMPAAEVMSQPPFAERRERIERACHQAGDQIVLEGKIDSALMNEVSDPETSQAKFQENANVFWESLDGKGTYLKDAPKLAYDSVLGE